MKTQHGGKRYGFFSGALWGLDTVVLAIALAMIPFADFGMTSRARSSWSSIWLSEAA